MLLPLAERNKPEAIVQNDRRFVSDIFGLVIGIADITQQRWSCSFSSPCFVGELLESERGLAIGTSLTPEVGQPERSTLSATERGFRWCHIQTLLRILRRMYLYSSKVSTHSGAMSDDCTAGETRSSAN
jgi:hypothetical protein